MLFYSIAGTLIFVTANFIFQIYYDYPEEYNFLQHLGTILLTALITEGLLFIESKSEKYKHCQSFKYHGLFNQLLISVVFVFICVSGFSIAIMLVFASDDKVIITWFDLFVTNLIAILYSGVVLVGLRLYKSDKELKNSLVTMERFKKERAEAMFHSMKMQLSPHFLFNTLNTLYGIIDKNPELAKDYLLKISDIYRYVLKNENNELIELNQELIFARDYAFLINKRFDNAFEFNVEVPERLLNKYIPPLTMQMLVENAIKHNILDKSNKLVISVYTNNDNSLIVVNNITTKNNNKGTTGLGLQNLNNRYKYLIDREIEIQHSNTEFTVEIPLINVENYASANN